MRAFHAGELVPSPTTLTRQPAAGTLSRWERARPQGAGEGITPKRLIRKGLFSWLLDFAQALLVSPAEEISIRLRPWANRLPLAGEGH